MRCLWPSNKFFKEFNVIGMKHILLGIVKRLYIRALWYRNLDFRECVAYGSDVKDYYNNYLLLLLDGCHTKIFSPEFLMACFALEITHPERSSHVLYLSLSFGVSSSSS